MRPEQSLVVSSRLSALREIDGLHRAAGDTVVGFWARGKESNITWVSAGMTHCERRATGTQRVCTVPVSSCRLGYWRMTGCRVIRTTRESDAIGEIR